MRRRKKLIIAILLVILIGLISVIAGALFLPQDNELAQGSKNILVCAIDESEPRPGMGACDMAFIVSLQDGELVNYTEIYPHGMTHPNASEPQEAQEQGAGEKLLLHDSFWDNDTKKSMQLAKEIVEYNTSENIDAVVAVNSEALDAILKSAGTLDVNGTRMNASGIDLIREEQYNGGQTRGAAVMDIVKAAGHAASDPIKKAEMINAALDQYSKGNIVMEPQGAFVGLLASKGINNLI